MLEILMSWFFLPVLVFVLGAVVKKYPPKTISNVYGYRTKRSRKNQATWDYSNKFCADLMFKCGIAELIVAALAAAFFWNNLYVMLALMCLESMTIIVIVIITEISLRKHFDKNGMRIL